MLDIKPLKQLLLAACALSLSLSAHAGYEEALSAYQAKDFSRAISEARQSATDGDARSYLLLGMILQYGQGTPANPTEAAVWYDKAAQNGVIGALSKLAQLHARGEGVPRNAEKALAYARQAAQASDPEGMFMVSVILKSTALNYFDAAGKVDNAKYQQLASRPLSDRSLDTEALDALYRSAGKGFPLATYTLALALGGTVGDGNRRLLLDMASKLPPHTNKALQNYERLARHMDGVGQTLVSPQLFYDAYASQLAVGMLATCGLPKDKDAPRPAPPQLVAITIAKPLSGATYLPSHVPGYERAYLVTGEWAENWTFRGCGKDATLTIRFSADGLGGARFVSDHALKADVPRQREQ
jgi:TPR repeat protein